MAAELKQRIRERGRRDRRDSFFAERLLDLIERIESEFHGEEHTRLLALASEAFERHLTQRDHTLRVREQLARLKADQQVLSDLFALLAARPSGSVFH
jgi:hypothetical protein